MNKEQKKVIKEKKENLKAEIANCKRVIKYKHDEIDLRKDTITRLTKEMSLCEKELSKL